MCHTVTERSIGIVTIYLGGPIDGLPIIKATAWRNYLTGKLEQLAPGRVATHAFRVLDPLRGFLLPEALGTDIIAVGATTTRKQLQCSWPCPTGHQQGRHFDIPCSGRSCVRPR